MKILLTGSTGLVGKNILDKYPKGYSYTLLTPNSKDLNLLEYSEVLDFFKIHKPDYVIHAAGVVGGIQANINYPVRFLVENTQIGNNLILAASKMMKTQILNIGSSCMFPKFATNPLKEESLLSGMLEPTNEGYAIAKIYAQRLCTYLNYELGEIRFKTVIPCNLYGKWDKFSSEWGHMIPAVIQKIHKATMEQQTEVSIWGDGMARREFMYASDFADFIWFAIANFATLPELMNVGLGKDYSINEYYQVIAEVIGFRGTFVHDLSKPVGMNQKLVDTSKMLQVGWKHKTTLSAGIEETYNYYKTINNAL